MFHLAQALVQLGQPCGRLPVCGRVGRDLGDLRVKPTDLAFGDPGVALRCLRLLQRLRPGLFEGHRHDGRVLADGLNLLDHKPLDLFRR